jgi:chromosome segregation ATPase
VAQQADLVRIQQEFEAKIAKIDQDKIALEATLAQANQAIQESKKDLAKQKSEVAELVRARAQFNSELRSLREENFPQLSGDLETESHRLQRLERVVDDLKADLNHRDQARATQITTLGKNIEKEFDQQDKTMSKHMVGFQASLVEFKDALAGIDTHVVTETTRAMTAETNMKNDFEAQQAALRGYLDTDIRTSLQSMAKAVEVEKTRATQSSKKLEARIQKLESTTNADVKQAQAQVVVQDKHVKDLNQSVLSMREVLDSMAGILGKRSDEQMKQIGKLTAQLDQMRQTQSTESSQQDANVQTLSSHVNEVTTSVQSVVTTLDQVKTSLSSRLDDQVARLAEQERRLTETANNSVSSQRLNQELFANVQQLNQLTTALGQLKNVVNNIGATLGEKVDEHEGQLTALAQQVRQLQSSSSSSPQSSTPPQTGKASNP